MAARKQRPKKPMSRERLQRAALRYLERYPASDRQLRRVLSRKLRRAEAAGDAIDETWVDEVATRCAELGYLNDARLAEHKARSLRRRGKSARQIRATLTRAGLGSAEIDAALSEEQTDADWIAAIAYARKRRLGPWRRTQFSPEQKQRELAVFGRAGFSFEIARKVIAAVDAAELEQNAQPNHDS